MVARPFMRFMSPQSAAKFLISHYSKCTSATITGFVMTRLKLCCFSDSGG